jgi:hypothetical protein
MRGNHVEKIRGKELQEYEREYKNSGTSIMRKTAIFGVGGCRIKEAHKEIIFPWRSSSIGHRSAKSNVVQMKGWGRRKKP